MRTLIILRSCSVLSIFWTNGSFLLASASTPWAQKHKIDILFFSLVEILIRLILSVILDLFGSKTSTQCAHVWILFRPDLVRSMYVEINFLTEHSISLSLLRVRNTVPFDSFSPKLSLLKGTFTFRICQFWVPT